jgi:hypothetical protein
MKLADLIKEDTALRDKFDALHDKLVPRSGAAETQEGEMVRAASRLGYRWYNDGDYFYEGYGAETAGPSATYLAKETDVPGLGKLVHAAVGKREKAYEAALDKIFAAILAFVESKDGNYSKSKVDSRSYKSEWEDESRYDDEEDDYDEDYR